MNKIFEKRILHLGLGRFHRGHQAVYFQKMAGLGDHRWGTISLSMRSTDARDQLMAVDLKYPVLELSEKQEQMIWVEAIQEVQAASADFEALMKNFCLPEIEIITLTVTEKGYCLTVQGELDLGHPQIKNDLRNPERPTSAIGILALGLKTRKQHNQEGLTILSCDNLRQNGQKLHGAVVKYISALGQTELLSWINTHVSFPDTMVDRIVPALTPEKVSEIEARYRLEKSELIATEEFSQWVIEDKFIKARPPWDKVGVEFVQDVKPFEEMKLRLLNAAHSYLAYAGLNRGHQYVHQAVADHELNKNVSALMFNEVIPLLAIPKGFDVSIYCQQLLQRFHNKSLPHQLKQIAMDGSLKLPQRIFPSLILAPHRNIPHQVLEDTLVEWLNFCWGKISNNPKELEDPIREEWSKLSFNSKSEWIEQVLKTNTFSVLNDLPRLLNKIQQKLIS